MKLAIKLAAAAAVLALATPALACDGMKSKTAENATKAAPAQVASAKTEAAPAKADVKKAETRPTTASN
jgi:hypothetical protein